MTQPYRAHRRRAAARQAGRPVVERGAAAREAALPRGEGRAHGHARSAGVGPAAAVFRRGDQVRATPARRAQAVHGDRALRHRDRRPAMRKARSAPRARSHLDVAELEPTLRSFIGRIAQVPPAYSALKYRGPRLLRIRARGASDPARRARRRDSRAAAGRMECARRRRRTRVGCSKGTYIRVLAEDIGDALGCGAHLAALRRTATGGYSACRRGIASAELEAHGRRGAPAPTAAGGNAGRGPAVARGRRDRRAALPAGSARWTVPDCADGIRAVFGGDRFLGVGDRRAAASRSRVAWWRSGRRSAAQPA